MSLIIKKLFKLWFKLRLHVQLVLVSGILLAVTISVATWLNIKTQKEELIQNISREATSLANNLAIISSYLIITDKLDELESLLIQSASFPSISMLRVISADGQSLSHVHKLESGEVIPVFDLSATQIPAIGNNQSISQIDWQSNQLTIWQPVKTSTLLGWVKMNVSLNNVIKLQQQTIHDNIIGAIVAIFIDVLVLLAILFIPARSFKKVLQFADNMTEKPGAQMNFLGGSYELNNLIKALNSSSSKQALQHDEIQQQANSLVKLNESLEQRVKNRTKELVKSNARLHLFNNAVEQNPYVTIITDKNGITEYVNPAFTTVTGYSAEEIIGKPPTVLNPDETQKEFLQKLSATLETGKTWSGLVRNKKSNGEPYWDQTQISAIKNSQGEITHYLSIQTDVTEKRQMEEQLRRNQKMDALGKLTGGIAHDYNNMLGIIIGYASILEDALIEQPKLHEYVKKIHHAGERGAQLTQKILSFSRHKTSDGMQLDINGLLLDMQLMLEKTLTARIELVLSLSDNLWPVWLDSGDLESAILNISINAMHAMETGGQLIIKTSNESIDNVNSRVLQLNTGDYVLLSISDTGIGMDEETKEKIFDPFFSTKGEKGTGLGLSQVYGFVERSGGAIKVYSEPGYGTRFTLYIPRSHHSVTTAKKQTQIPNQIMGNTLQGKETLLVVDDEQAIAELAYEHLTAQGYHVLIANNAEQALAILENESVDLLISDVIMPNMDGYQLAAIVQQRYPHIKIQMASGFTDGRHNGISDTSWNQNILHKPYNSKTLLECVRGLLDEHNIKDSHSTRTILVMDDEESVRDLFSYNLARLGYKTILAQDSEEAINLYQQSREKGESVDAIIMDLSIPGGPGAKEIVNKIRMMDPHVKIIVTSGDPDAPEMLHYQDYGFHGMIEKDFDRKKIQQVIKQVLLNS